MGAAEEGVGVGVGTIKKCAHGHRGVIAAGKRPASVQALGT